MINVVVVKNLVDLNIYYLSQGDSKYKMNDLVLFNTDSGKMIGKVIKEEYPEKKENLIMPLFSILSLASNEDVKKYEDSKVKASKALYDAKEISAKLNLEMSFVDAYYNFDNSQLYLSFIADNRIDFRELVKQLAYKYKTRIELVQIGIRDKARRIGGLGPCGMQLCCNRFLTDFNSVSISMAKNQLIALNPTKINGLCGRLLCCLGYENDTYLELKKELPKVGFIVNTSKGTGKVVNVDVLKGEYSVDFGEQGIVVFKKDEK
jgi:predicted peptidase